MTVFRFASSATLAAAPDAVFAVLEDAEHWDRWWPQIRQIRRFSDRHGQVRIRSVLPLWLTIELTEDVRDPAAGVLRARLDGDLCGWSQFTVTPVTGGSCRVDYAQESALTRFPTWLAVLGTPVLRLNHAAMMRAGMRGLEAAARNT